MEKISMEIKFGGFLKADFQTKKTSEFM